MIKLIKLSKKDNNNMDYFKDVRVATEASHKQIYNDLRNAKAIGEFKELFFACAVIGYINKQKTPLQKKDDRFYADTFTPSEKACLYSMYYCTHNNDFATLNDDKLIMSDIEEYANTGMNIIIDDFLQPFLTQKSVTPALDSFKQDDLPKMFLNYIFESVNA